MHSVGQKNKICSFQVLGLTFWKKKMFSSVNKEEKQSPFVIKSFCNKIEEHS